MIYLMIYKFIFTLKMNSIIEAMLETVGSVHRTNVPIEERRKFIAVEWTSAILENSFSSWATPRLVNVLLDQYETLKSHSEYTLHQAKVDRAVAKLKTLPKK